MEKLTVEGIWEVVSVSINTDKQYIGNKISISRQGDRYEVKEANTDNGELWFCTGNERRIIYTNIELLHNPKDEFEGNNIPASVAQKLAGQKVPINNSYTLSADGNFLTLETDSKLFYWDLDTTTGKAYNVRYEIKPANNKKILKRISGPAKDGNNGERAYKADCGTVDPNRTEPFPPNHEFCPGNLVCMTNFCGGGMGCPYVCCPKRLPYLNHCDCKCYATSDFDCHSYSYCREKLIK